MFSSRYQAFEQQRGPLDYDTRQKPARRMTLRKWRTDRDDVANARTPVLPRNGHSALNQQLSHFLVHIVRYARYHD